jgi:hypothetical protein
MRGLRPTGLAVTLLAVGAAAASAREIQTGFEVSRTIVVDPLDHPRLGVMQYRESLPLEDHEVVLTFDDGPLPPRTNHILDILASDCVKAIFFLVGRMATTYPDVARKVAAAGHTIGTHDWTKVTPAQGRLDELFLTSRKSTERRNPLGLRGRAPLVVR